MMEGVRSGGQEPRVIKEFCVDDGNDDPIVTTCPSGANDCPAVFPSAKPGYVVIQGYVVDRPGLPAGEARVSVPVELIRDAYHALGVAGLEEKAAAGSRF